MAYLFDDAKSEYLVRNEAVVNAVPFAMVCWFNSDNINADQILMAIAASANDLDSFDLRIRGAEDGDPVAAAVHSNAGAWDIAESSSGYSADTWHHACGLFVSGTDRRIFLDGDNKGTNAEPNTPTAVNLDRTSIGALIRATPAAYMSGIIAEAAIYDLTTWPGATDSDKADAFEKILPSLAKGFSPLFYPSGLKAYYPLVRNANDKVGGYNLT